MNQFVDQIANQSANPVPKELLEFISTSLLAFVNSLTLETALQAGLFVWLSQALINGILVGPFIALFLGFNNQRLSQTTYPGQRLVHSYRNSIRFLLSTALLVVGIALVNHLLNYLIGQYLVEMPAAELLNGLANEYEFSMELFLQLIIELTPALITELVLLAMLSTGISLMLYFALACGIIGGLRFGGITLLQHYVLRLIITHNHYLPWRIIPFLDYCVDRIFLRRIGGGYIFIHRLIMEHFAVMPYESESAKKPPSMETPSS